MYSKYENIEKIKKIKKQKSICVGSISNLKARYENKKSKKK